MLFFFIFLMEMFVKMLGIGLHFYFKDGFCIFDFVVIVLSLIEIVIDQVNKNVGVGLNAIRALRVFRLLRVFKLARIWKSFHDLLNIFFFTLTKIGYLSVIVCLCLVTYAILGKEIFAYKLSFTPDGRPLEKDFDFENARFKEGFSPDFNFDTFLNSFFSVFLTITVTGWSDVYY
jgi:hypothetical protein